MTKILVPTDFSADAFKALQFAAQLAKKEHCRLILMNVFQLPPPVAMVPYAVLDQEEKDAKHASETALRAEYKRLESPGRAPAEFISIEGDPIHAILQVAEEKKAEYIVMGTAGKGMNRGVFGSVTTRVIAKAQCPVIAVPAGASFELPVNRIAYATDLLLSDVKCIEAVVKMASLLNAHVTVVHVATDQDRTPAEDEKLMNKLLKSIAARTGSASVSMQMLQGADIVDELERYVNGGNTDMLVMSTHFRTLLDRIFGKSLTRRMALNSPVPVMAFHHNSESAVKLFS